MDAFASFLGYGFIACAAIVGLAMLLGVIKIDFWTERDDD